MLTVAPWTAFWQRNYFVDVLPWMGPVMASAVARLVVVLAGLATALGGMTDLRAALSARSDEPSSDEVDRHPSSDQ